MFSRGENFFHRHFFFFLFSRGSFWFSPIWTQGMLSRPDCCWACIPLWAPLWLWEWCLCCGAWLQLQAGHLVPQGELLGKTLSQAFAGQWKIYNSWKSLMEINNFPIILCLRTDSLPSCVLSYYLHLNQPYRPLLWHRDILSFSGQTHMIPQRKG